MYYPIIKMSFYAENILKSAACGKIHSIYRKTINLSFDGRLAAVQEQGSPLSPISLICGISTNEISALSLEPNDSVIIHPDYIEIQGKHGTVALSFKNTARHDLELPRLIDDSIARKLFPVIENAISRSQTGGIAQIFQKNSSSDLPLIFQAAKSRLLRSFNLYRKEAICESALELSGLLGLGIGLTPSGDDFLCGVLAGLRIAKMEDTLFARTLKEQIAGRLSDTIDISAAFLTCALDNQYSLAVNQLLTIPEPEEILSIFTEIGHSSGMDTLCGVWFALQLFRASGANGDKIDLRENHEELL